MANKTFYLDRETDPLDPQLVVANKDELIKVYDTVEDLNTDVANLEDDEIASCKGNDYTGIMISETVRDGDKNPITSEAVYNAIDGLGIPNANYVLGEVDTGTTWIDGKHIYRNVINCGALPNNSTKTVAHNIVGFDTVVHAFGMTKNTTGPVFLPLVFALPSGNSPTIGFSIDATNINIITGADRSVYTQTYIVLEYTKSE